MPIIIVYENICGRWMQENEEVKAILSYLVSSRPAWSL